MAPSPVNASSRHLIKAVWALRMTLILVPMLATAATTALVEGGTNLAAPGYPVHKCSRPPTKPEKPFRNDEYSMRSYSDEVDRYNRALTNFRDCVSSYVDNANADIKRIQEAATMALNDFRSLPQ